jgi:iron complex outermembrane receptor protein
VSWSRPRAALSCAATLALLFHAPALFAQAAVSPPVPVEHTDPIYPEARLAEGIEANVEVALVVEKDGSVSKAEIVSSAGPEFDDAALAAVRSWRFVPATRDGAPVRAKIRIPFHFAPGPHAPEVSHPLPPPRRAAEPPSGPSAGAPVATEERAVEAFGTPVPHGVSEPGKPIEVHVQGRVAPPRAVSDIRLRREALDAAPHATAADLLSPAPGIYVSHPEGEAVAQRIYLRGFDADHGQDVALSVGGLPLNQPSHIHGQGYADLAIVIPETVRSVRVLEGVYDPSQGDFAVAGSADFDLGVSERGLRLSTSIGSWNTRRLLALWAPEGEAEETFAAAELRTTDGFGDGTRGAVSGGAVVQYRVELPSHVLGQLHVAARGARAGIAGVLREDDVDAGRVGIYDSYPDPTARAQSASTSRAQVAFRLEHAGEHGAHTEASVWAYLADYRSRLNFTGYRERSRQNPEWAGKGDLVEQMNHDVALGASAKHSTTKARLSSWLDVSGELGLDTSLHDVDQAQNLLEAPQNETWDRRIDASLRTLDVGVFGDATLGLTRYVRLRLGARADLVSYDVDDRLGNFIPAFQQATHIEGFRRTAAGIAAGPRTSLEVHALPWLTVLAAYGEGYRSPQARQLEEGESAPFAKVRSYEAGARAFHEDLFTVSTAAYETRLDYDLAFDAEEGRVERIGPTSRRGVVLHAESSASPGFYASASATYVHASLDAPPAATPDDPNPAYREGELLPYVPPVVVRTDCSYGRRLTTLVDAPLEGRIGFGTTFLSPRPLPYGQEAPPVFVADALLSVRRTFLEAELSVTNLLGAEYADTAYSFVSSWHPGEVPSALPARHFAAAAPRAFTFTLSLFL